MPYAIGIIVVSGILAAGMSSASTFLSLLGISLANDIVTYTVPTLQKARLLTLIPAVCVLIIALLNKAQIFWTMYFGASLLAAAWFPAMIATIWWPKASEKAIFSSMLTGLILYVATRIFSTYHTQLLPIYLDPFFIAIIASTTILLSFSYVFPANRATQLKQMDLHHNDKFRPIQDQLPVLTHQLAWLYLLFGILVSLFFIIGWAVPHYSALST